MSWFGKASGGAPGMSLAECSPLITKLSVAEGADNSFVCTIRQGDWILLYWEKYDRLEVYNLKDDIKEQHDLAKVYREKTKKLALLLMKRLKEYHAQRPLYITNGKPVPWPDKVRQGMNL